MRKLLVPFAFLGATTAVACSFQVGSGKSPQSPQAQPGGSAAPSQSGTSAAPSGPVHAPLGKKRTSGQPGPTPSNTSGGSTTPPGIPVVTGTTVFGGGTPIANGWKGNVYFIPAGTTHIPDLGSMQPNGFVFIGALDIGHQAFAEGFPGIDPNHRENFAIRYEAPLLVADGGDYDFKVTADDGAIVRIDGTVIVDNDGVHDFKDKTGPVHLVNGTHVITVDYFQTTGNVGLKLECGKHGAALAVCPTHL